MSEKYSSLNRIYFLRKSYLKRKSKGRDAFEIAAGNYFLRKGYSASTPFSQSDDGSSSRSTFDYEDFDDYEDEDDFDDDSLKDHKKWKNNDHYYCYNNDPTYRNAYLYDQEYNHSGSSNYNQEMKVEMGEHDNSPSRWRYSNKSSNNSTTLFSTPNFIGTPSPDSPENQILSYGRICCQKITSCISSSFRKRCNFFYKNQNEINNLSRHIHNKRQQLD